MINTNTDKPTQKPTATISESSIYLKKSELPQNVSSFKNDAGYISSSALSAWLKEHSYISKTEITSLINKANLVVVDTVNKSADSKAINRLDLIEKEIVEIKDVLNKISNTYVSTESINSLATKIDIAKLSDEIDTISTNLSNIDLSSIATKDEIPSIDGLAEKDWVESRGYITLSALSRYAKKSEIPTLNGYATQDWVNEQGFLTEVQDLSGLVKKTELKDYVKTTSLNNYAKKSDLPTDYIKESDLSEYVKVSEISSTLNDYAKKSSLSEYVKTSTFNSKLNSLAKKSDIEGYATQKWVNEQGFLTKNQDLSEFATKTDLKDYVKIKSLDNTLNGYVKKNSVYTQNESDSKFLSKIDASDIYLTETSADVKYASKEVVESEYLRIEDYRGLKSSIVINDDYKEESLEKLKGDLNKLINGFYIVNHTDVVIVKDHDVANIFKDGTPQAVIKWKEE